MVGKTSILTRYIKGKFIKIDNRTVNTNCMNKNITLNGIVFDLNIWDTAGEEKYQALAPIFYRGADGAVIIFDCTRKETFDRAEKWFKELKEFAETNTRIVLVGNKIDLPKINIKTEQAGELAKKFDANFLEVSALTGRNVNEVFETLASEIYEYRKKIKEEATNKFLEDSNNYSNSSKKKKIVINRSSGRYNQRNDSSFACC